MTELHTKGRITFKEDGDANHYSMLTEDGRWWLAVLVNGEQTSERQIANFRRLAACWNSCEGIETDWLEKYPTGFDSLVSNSELVKQCDQQQAHIRELEAQLNAAILARREAQQAEQAAIEARNRAGVEIRRTLLAATAGCIPVPAEWINGLLLGDRQHHNELRALLSAAQKPEGV